MADSGGATAAPEASFSPGNRVFVMYILGNTPDNGGSIGSYAAGYGDRSGELGGYAREWRSRARGGGGRGGVGTGIGCAPAVPGGCTAGGGGWGRIDAYIPRVGRGSGLGTNVYLGVPVKLRGGGSTGGVYRRDGMVVTWTSSIITRCGRF